LLWGTAERLLLIGVDVILDFGLWYRSQRDEFREKATKIGVSSKLYLVTCSPEDQLNRISKRNAELKDLNIFVDPTQLAEFAHKFETPTSEEGAIIIRT
jgi:predicted kinase